MNYAQLLTGPADTDATPIHPLTHHEILSLVQPFTRRGYQVDLAATDRIARRLMFKPVMHDEAGQGGIDATELLQLDSSRPGQHVLIRNLTLANGLAATLETQGDDIDRLLQRIQTVLPQQQFRTVEGTVIALSYRLTASKTPQVGDATVQRVLLRGEAEVAGFRVVLRGAQVRGYPAEIDITPRTQGVPLPEDLLAVIGWAWSPLRKSKAGFTGKVQVRGQEPERSPRVEAALERTVAHLARTLTRPPAAYYETLRGARWKVTFRRAIPALFFGGLIAGAASLTLIDVPQDSIFNLLLMGAPPLLMFGAFGMRETPSLEIPPLPRRWKATWLPEPEAAPSQMEAQTT
ncbi:hypothetical protein DNX69_22010 [Rhodopseudomonas palustris]|uniref:Uncharacterized protein n=1 Tax=Rhodopseudomonas palustris TaxID=1076 RepID=A0A323UCT6_RHOPL|nr:hypothetical protein [Rhodopseudomonas palustris]PZA10007.1 hypothetical protein DNX69_22010 [Rhodopseudomonas palustris]